MLSTRNLLLLRKVLPGVRYFASEVNYQEIRIPVPWGHIAGKWWGPTDTRPILTIHGWQDNCGSFNRLIPLLNKNVGYLAIDLPGHGFSSRIPSGLYCHFSDYLVLVHYLVNYFKWEKVSLMGHSMGGITSFLYTMLNPEKVDMLICIDGSKPMLSTNNISRIVRNITAFQRYVQYEMSTKEPPSYTIEEIQRKIHEPNQNSVDLAQTLHLAERNIAPSQIHKGKYYFTRDPRLKSGDLVNFPQEDSLEGASRIKNPTFICKAKGAPNYEPMESLNQALNVLRNSNPDFQYHYLDGTHHIHLNNPEVELAPLLTKFIDKYNVEDRSDGFLNQKLMEIKS